MHLVDIGFNLTSSQFAHDHHEVVSRALAANVQQFIITGTSISESQQAAVFAEKYQPHAWFTSGIHPHHADDFTPTQLSELVVLAQHPRHVAIGECGLDFYRHFASVTAQEHCFQHQLELSIQLNKPAFMHERDAYPRFISIIDEVCQDQLVGVVHCFTNDLTALRAYLDRGFYIGITGWICDERRGQALQQLIQYVPLDRLLIETDAPFLLPRNLQPKPHSRRNEPQYLPHIAQSIAQLYQISFEQLVTQTMQNSIKLFTLTL